MTLIPEITGSVAIRSPAVRFVQAFERRVAAGLLSGQAHPRSNYEVTDSGPTHLRVRAADWWTAINVGLNEMELQLAQPGSVQYRVRYWRWARYVILLSGVFGVVGVALLLTLEVRGYIARHASARLPTLSVDSNLLLAWAMVLFWGFAWPWVLIVLHKLPLHRLVARLIGEVDAQVTSD